MSLFHFHLLQVQMRLESILNQASPDEYLVYCILEYGLHNVAVHARVFGLLAERLFLIRRHEADEWLLLLATASERLVYRRLA